MNRLIDHHSKDAIESTESQEERVPSSEPSGGRAVDTHTSGVRVATRIRAGCCGSGLVIDLM